MCKTFFRFNNNNSEKWCRGDEIMCVRVLLCTVDTRRKIEAHIVVDFVSTRWIFDSIFPISVISKTFLQFRWMNRKSLYRLKLVDRTSFGTYKFAPNIYKRFYERAKLLTKRMKDRQIVTVTAVNSFQKYLHQTTVTVALIEASYGTDAQRTGYDAPSRIPHCPPVWLTPLSRRMYPSMPHWDDQLFFTFQYGVPSSQTP